MQNSNSVDDGSDDFNDDHGDNDNEAQDDNDNDDGDTNEDVGDDRKFGHDSGTIDAMHFFECNPEFDHE